MSRPALEFSIITRPALIASGLILAPVLLLYARAIRRDRPLAASRTAETEQPAQPVRCREGAG